MKYTYYFLALLGVANSLSLSATSVRMCTAIPGSAEGPNTQGGDAFCGSQRKPARRAFGAVGDLSVISPTELSTLESFKIAILEEKPIDQAVSTLLTLPTLGQKQLITYRPSQGTLAGQLCTLLLIVKPSSSSTKDHSEAILTVNRLKPAQDTRSPISFTEIAAITLPSPTPAQPAKVLFMMERDGTTHAALNPLTLPLGTAELTSTSAT